VGIQKESRPDQCQDQTSTLLPDNTLNFSSRGCCAGVLSIDNMPRIFYIPLFFPDQITMIKTLVFLFEEISKTRFPREKVLSAT
jgi:hypothetical protein